MKRQFYKLAVTISFALLAASLMLLSPSPLKAQATETPIVIQAVAPIYPSSAINARIMGIIFVDALVESHGAVTSVSIVDKHGSVITSVHNNAGYETLRKSAMAAAKRWRFSNSEIGTRTAHLIFTFKFVDENNPEDLMPVFTLPNRVEVRAATPIITTTVN